MSDQNLDYTQPKTTADKPKKAAPLSDGEMKRIANITKAHLDAQPKRKIRLPKSQNPKDPNFETVQINGYTFIIKRGEDVEVPDEVAQILYRAGY